MQKLELFGYQRLTNFVVQTDAASESRASSLALPSRKEEKAAGLNMAQIVRKQIVDNRNKKTVSDLTVFRLFHIPLLILPIAAVCRNRSGRAGLG